jgi:hypothetical protein
MNVARSTAADLVRSAAGSICWHWSLNRASLRSAVIECTVGHTSRPATGARSPVRIRLDRIHGEWLMRVGPHGSDPLERPVDRGAADTEELGQFDGAVGTQIVQLDEVSGLVDGELGLLPFQMTFRTGSFMPTRVRILIRSDSNSATIASTLNSSRPIGSFGAWIDPPRLSRTFFPVSWTRCRWHRAATGPAGPAW